MQLDQLPGQPRLARVQQTLGSIRLLAELRRELFDQAPTDEEVVAQATVTPAA